MFLLWLRHSGSNWVKLHCVAWNNLRNGPSGITAFFSRLSWLRAQNSSRSPGSNNRPRPEGEVQQRATREMGLVLAPPDATTPRAPMQRNRIRIEATSCGCADCRFGEQAIEHGSFQLEEEDHEIFRQMRVNIVVTQVAPHHCRHWTWAEKLADLTYHHTTTN